MFGRRYLLVGLPLIGATGALGLLHNHSSHLTASPLTVVPVASTSAAAAQTTQRSPFRGRARLPLTFESNQGQADRRVRFLAHSGENTLLLTPTEAVFAMPGRKPASLPLGNHVGGGAPQQTSLSALRMQLVGADPNAQAIEEQPLAGRVNYFIGHDPSRWHSDIPTFGRAKFQSVYPGVDVVYYGNQQHLEYDFVVAPHADPSRIQLNFAGTDSVRVSRQGDLIVNSLGRTLTWRKPTVYQESDRGKRSVEGRFRLEHSGGQSRVSFALGRYDSGRQLVIDPLLVYSTYLGGSNANGDNANGITVDSQGNAYLTGNTYSTDFPVTSGALQTTNKATSGGLTAFVTKLNPTGTALVYSTYIGGSSGTDSGNTIAVDAQGDAYVAGSTSSTDFPITTGAYQSTNKAANGNATAFITRLNPTGTALVYSTFLGGSNGDGVSKIVLDSQGTAYVVGTTSSTDFPVTAGAALTANPESGGATAFVTSLNPTGNTLVYSTYLGGSTGSENGNAIAVDSQGDVYVTGSTTSTDFPVTNGAFQTTNNVATGGATAFVTNLNANGTIVLYSTYLGGTNGDSGNAIAVDSQGNAYIAGNTFSTDFPVTTGAFQAVNKAATGGGTGFVTKLNPNGSSLVYSTYLGGTNSDYGDAIAVDSQGYTYVACNTASTDFPVTVGALQATNKTANGSGTIAVTKVSPTGAALIYSTYLGGTNSDDVNAIAVDSQGNTYVTGNTFSTDFPITTGAFQKTNKAAVGGGETSFVSRLSTVPVFPDFNGDGLTDLLLQNSNTGVIGSWFMNGASMTGSATFSLNPSVNYALVGAGSFSGNGTTALVLQNRTDNSIALWYTGGVNGATITGGDYVSPTPSAGYKVIGVGDFNGDGKSDLLFQNQTSGQIVVWFMNGPVYQGGTIIPIATAVGWKLVGTGDFNGDGFPDLVFQNQNTNQIAIWYMHGTTYAGGTVLASLPAAGWKIVGVGDYNGDGYADLLLQNQTTNQAVVWFLKSGAYLGGSALSMSPPTGWKIVGPH